MAKPVVTDKTAYCPCGAVRTGPDGTNKDADGLPLHKVTMDDVWYEEIAVGDLLIMQKVFPRHFKMSHGFMGSVIHQDTGQLFHVQSASADSTQRLLKVGAGQPLYPNAQKN